MAPSAEVSAPSPAPDVEYRGPSKVKFDPLLHLNFIPPSKVYTLSELGVPPETGTSDLAATEPFQLATEAAVVELRRELLQDNTLQRRLHWWPRSPACCE